METSAADDFKKLLLSIPEVKENRQYWFVRTEAGSLYQPFLEENLIGVGYTNIELEEIKAATDLDPKERLEKIKDLVKIRHDDISMAGLAASNISRFFFDMQKGDIAIIPSPSSQLLSFGIVQDDSVKPGEKTETMDLTGYKTRKVKWLKTISRDSLNPKLYSLFFSHQAIVSGNEYAGYIDSTLNDFYVKDEKIHLQIRVQKKEEILARELFGACIGFLEITDDFLKAHGINENTSDVEVKISVNSPGVVEFIGCSFLALIVLGFCITAFAGGGIDGKILGQGISFKTDGILEKISKFLNEHEKRKVLSHFTKKLDIKNPDDAIKIIKKLTE